VRRTSNGMNGITEGGSPGGVEPHPTRWKTLSTCWLRSGTGVPTSARSFLRRPTDGADSVTHRDDRNRHARAAHQSSPHSPASAGRGLNKTTVGRHCAGLPDCLAEHGCVRVLPRQRPAIR